MSQPTYSVVVHGSVSVEMGNQSCQQRIMPPPQKWCNARRTKVIIASVILTILFIIVLVVKFEALLRGRVIPAHSGYGHTFTY